MEILDHVEYPIYFHCRRGADRTGLACVVAKVLTTDASWEEARGQLNCASDTSALAGRDIWISFSVFTPIGSGEPLQTHSKERFGTGFCTNTTAAGAVTRSRNAAGCPP